MNSKIMAVIRREFVTRVRSKMFIISTLLLPVFFLIAAFAPILIMSHAGQNTARVAIVDGTTSGLGQRVETALAASKLGSGADAKPRYELTLVPAADKVEQVRKRLISQTALSGDDAKKGYDGVLVLPADVLENGKVTYYGNNVSSPTAMASLQHNLSKTFAATRLADQGLDLATVSRAMRPVNLATKQVSEGKQTGKSGVSTLITAYVMAFLLYFAIILFGQQTMTSVIEEKTSRVMEVLVSSLTPFQMLMGKVIGVGGAGLLQMAIWGLSGWVITSQAGHLAGMVGVDPAAMAAFQMPSIGFGMVLIFLAYFSLGYLFYGALFAAIGSMCNTVQETQQFVSVVTVLIMLGFFGAFGVVSSPTGPLGEILSLIPLFAPFVMPVYWSVANVSAGELIASLVLMLIGIWICVWLAARIYHTGILMFGKKPSLRELWRWIRAS